MALALQTEEREVIVALLEFANLRAVKSVPQVQRIFAKIIDFRETMPSWIDGQGRERQAIGPDAYAEDHRRAKHWLGEIVGSAKARREVAREVARVVAEAVDVRFAFDGRRSKYVYRFGSVTAVCAFAAALFLDEARGLTRRLQRCGWSQCQKFNLDFEPKGRPRRFCPGHKEKHDNETARERVDRFRRKARKKAKTEK